jgi:hypothetical protein
MDSLWPLVKLSRLFMDQTSVGDAGLLRLKGLKSICFIWLRGTKVTDSGVQEFQKSPPYATIMR